MSGKKLVFVTQVVDASDPVLGFTVDLIRALAQRFSEVLVIANRVSEVPQELGAKVVSLGKEGGAGQIRRGYRYERELSKALRHMRPDALLAHMCPVYLNLAAPLCKPRGVRLMLWFAHPAKSRSLATAEGLADRVLTPFADSYPRKSTKVRAVGQGIDTSRFEALPLKEGNGPLRLLALGRTSPVKGYPTMVDAARLLRDQGHDVILRIVGPSTTPQELRHRRELERSIQELGLEDRVILEPGMPHERVSEVLRESDGLVSATIQGSGDKAVLEAMASARPVIVSNPVFASLLEGMPLGLTFREGDGADLARRLAEVATASPEVRAETGRRLRSRVEEGHSISGWANRVYETVVELGASKPRVRKSFERA